MILITIVGMQDSLVLLSYLLILAGNYLGTLEDQVKQLNLGIKDLELLLLHSKKRFLIKKEQYHLKLMMYLILENGDMSHLLIHSSEKVKGSGVNHHMF